MSNLENIRTGDILLFSNWTNVGISIKVATFSQWNHVGIAVWIDRVNVLKLSGRNLNQKSEKFSKTVKDKTLFVFETNQTISYDHLSQHLGDGCRLIEFNNLVPFYSRIAWRPVKVKRDEHFYDNLWTFINHYSGAGYTQNKLTMILNALQWPSPHLENNSTEKFCSQLTANYLQLIGYKLNKPTYTYLPRHFSAYDRQALPDEYFEGFEVIIYDQKGSGWWLIWPIVLIILASVIWLGVNGRLGRKIIMV